VRDVSEDKTEPGEKAYTVKSGQTVVERISELTGISERTVRSHLDDRYKQGQEKVATLATLGERVEVGVLGVLASTSFSLSRGMIRLLWRSHFFHSLSGLRPVERTILLTSRPSMFGFTFKAFATAATALMYRPSANQSTVVISSLRNSSDAKDRV